MAVPRRLEITLNIDFNTETHRNLHSKRVFDAAEDAIAAALATVQEALLDDDISAQVASEINWGYAWKSRRDEQPLVASAGAAQIDEEQTPVGE